jgi:serine phosphatase RsbU (regulator of sigma subunit)
MLMPGADSAVFDEFSSRKTNIIGLLKKATFERMIKIKVLNWERASTKIVLVVFVSLLMLSGYYIVSSYYEYLKTAEEQTLEKLKGISNTLSLQINGDEHEYLTKKYKNTDDIKINTQDSVYNKIHLQLLEAFRINGFKEEEEVLTMILDSSGSKLYFAVNSKDKPYFRTPYTSFDPKFISNYATGATINAYTDDLGTWLTAFSPIKNKKGEVVAIVEVDQLFGHFIKNANLTLYKNLLISVIIFIITAIFLLRYVRVVLVSEEKVKSQLQLSNKIINEKNHDILQSINYAKKIQNAILPPIDLIQSSLPHSFVLYNPKDIVSGDFYFFIEMIPGEKFIIAACDCTGHGVPGALMSMIGSDLLRHIIKDKPSLSPAQILDQLNIGVVSVLKQDSRYGETKDGMDVGICLIDKPNRSIEFAGANRPLLIIKNNQIQEIKGDKRPIGGFDVTSEKYTNHKITIENGARYYLFSDGYADQFGGQNNKKFLIKNLKSSLLQVQSLSFDQQHKTLLEIHNSWKGLNEQTDDLLMIGFEVG